MFAPLFAAFAFREWEPAFHTLPACVFPCVTDAPCLLSFGAAVLPVFVRDEWEGRFSLTYGGAAYHSQYATAMPPTSSYLCWFVRAFGSMAYRLQYALAVPTTFPYIHPHKNRRAAVWFMLLRCSGKCGRVKIGASPGPNPTVGS